MRALRQNLEDRCAFKCLSSAHKILFFHKAPCIPTFCAFLDISLCSAAEGIEQYPRRLRTILLDILQYRVIGELLYAADDFMILLDDSVMLLDYSVMQLDDSVIFVDSVMVLVLSMMKLDD